MSSGISLKCAFHDGWYCTSFYVLSFLSWGRKSAQSFLKIGFGFFFNVEVSLSNFCFNWLIKSFFFFWLRNLAKQCWKDFVLESFMILGFTFRSIVYVELSFLCIMWCKRVVLLIYLSVIVCSGSSLLRVGFVWLVRMGVWVWCVGFSLPWFLLL